MGVTILSEGSPLKVTNLSFSHNCHYKEELLLLLLILLLSIASSPCSAELGAGTINWKNKVRREGTHSSPHTHTQLSGGQSIVMNNKTEWLKQRMTFVEK